MYYLYAIIVVLLIVIVFYSLYPGKKEGIITSPKDEQIPIIRMLKTSFWKKENGIPMLIRPLTDRKLRWYGLGKEPIEMQYELIDSNTVVVHTPALEDYNIGPSFTMIEVNDSNYLTLTIGGKSHLLKRTYPSTIYLNEIS